MSNELKELAGLFKELNSNLEKVLQATVQQPQVNVTTTVTEGIDASVPGLGDIKDGIVTDEGPTQANIDALALETRKMDDFCSRAHAEWKLTRKESRELYREARTRLQEAGNWPKKTAAKAPPTPEPKPDAQPTTTSVPQGQALLTGIELEARRLLTVHGSNVIPVIKYIREQTGFQLLEAKFMVDMMNDPTMEEPAQLTQAKEEFLRRKVAEGAMPLDAQVQVLRQTAIDKEMDPEKGKIEGQKKIDIAGDSKNELVQVARRIGRTMAANGPITIDDITAEMGKRYNVMPVTGKRKHQWKGSVFNKTEWVCIGEQPSQQKSAHARPVGLWALKTWLKENTVNGKDTSISAFVMTRLYNDFKRIHPKVDLAKCNCYVGEERLNADIRKSIVDGQNRLYEIPATFRPGSVGAIITPPDPAAVLG